MNSKISDLLGQWPVRMAAVVLAAALHVLAWQIWRGRLVVVSARPPQVVEVSLIRQPKSVVQAGQPKPRSPLQPRVKPVAKMLKPVTTKPKPNPVQKKSKLAPRSSPKSALKPVRRPIPMQASKPLPRITPKLATRPPKATSWPAPRRLAESIPASEPTAPLAASPPVAAEPGTLVPAAAPTQAASYKAAYLENPPPRYPALAREQGWQGLVSVRTHILADGTVGEVRLERGSGHDVLDEAALDSVKGWRFVAARRGDQAVDSWVIIPINFKTE